MRDLLKLQTRMWILWSYFEILITGKMLYQDLDSKKGLGKEGPSSNREAGVTDHNVKEGHTVGQGEPSLKIKTVSFLTKME